MRKMFFDIGKKVYVRATVDGEEGELVFVNAMKMKDMAVLNGGMIELKDDINPEQMSAINKFIGHLKFGEV